MSVLVGAPHQHDPADPLFDIELADALQERLERVGWLPGLIEQRPMNGMTLRLKRPRQFAQKSRRGKFANDKLLQEPEEIELAVFFHLRNPLERSELQRVEVKGWFLTDLPEPLPSPWVNQQNSLVTVRYEYDQNLPTRRSYIPQGRDPILLPLEEPVSRALRWISDFGQEILPIFIDFIGDERRPARPARSRKP